MRLHGRVNVCGQRLQQRVGVKQGVGRAAIGGDATEGRTEGSYRVQGQGRKRGRKGPGLDEFKVRFQMGVGH